MTAKLKKGFNPTFDNGGFWEYYRDLERQFEDFLMYVPYLKGNEGTYSFRLANLILSIGAHIDSAFRVITTDQIFSNRYPKMLNPIGRNGRPRKHTIHDYYPISDEYKLPKQIVEFKCLPNREEILPFKNYKKKKKRNEVPYWWTTYNNVKHHFHEHFKEAKLKTVRDALAGAFLLNVVHNPAALRLFDYGMLRPKYPPKVMWKETYDTFKGREQHLHRPNYETEDPFKIETSLFTYDYEKVKKPISS